MGKKIFARKKILMSHAKAHQTSRVESKKETVVNNAHNFGGKMETLQKEKSSNIIEIKYIESP